MLKEYIIKAFDCEAHNYAKTTVIAESIEKASEEGRRIFPGAFSIKVILLDYMMINEANPQSKLRLE